MKWTLNWLKDYLNTELSAQDIAERLTQIGLEIEEIKFPIVPVVAKIIECADIPDTHLHLLRVDDGQTVRQVVCGAPNARVGLVSALARPGCKIGDMEIKVGKIRGYESNGMMCSQKELDQGEDHSGIIELDESIWKLGMPLRDSNDAIFDANVTPNRSDYLSVRGIARDLAVAGIGEFKLISDTKRCPDFSEKRKVIIENNNACSIYRMCEIHNIKIADSNALISKRLSAIGINPRNAAVDATNYVCYDLGQPMHCFDADQIHGDIIVRNAKLGEKFVDLFDAEHNLTTDDLVITDAEGILALAGIIGGKRGMTTDETKNIILEAAYFDAVSVRKTAKRLGLSTDASYRFERGIDSAISDKAIEQCAKIIMEQCGGEFFDSFVAGKTPKSREVHYSSDLFKQKTGLDLPAHQQEEILWALGFSSGDNSFIVPTWRPDVQISENIVSELIRIYGYHKVKTSKIKPQDATAKISEVKQLLSLRGLSEVVTYGFGNRDKEALVSDRSNIKIKNPIVDTLDTARNSLVQNMLDVIAGNDRFKRSNLNLFELGVVFDGDKPGEQHDQLLIIRTGVAGNKIGTKHGKEVSIYDVRADLLALFPGATIKNDPSPEKWAHPFRAGVLIKEGKTIARFAEILPAVAKKFGIKTNVVVGQVDYINDDKASGIKIVKSGKKYSLAEFPMITRDFAFIAGEDISQDKIVQAALSAESSIVETNIFDVFDMGDGKKSIAFEVVLQPEQNLTDSDLIDIQNRIISSVEKLGAKIRDK